MNIKNLYIKNFLGITLFDVAINMPVCLVAGANASGKSSIQNAVRMVLTGEPSRVSLKGKYGELVQTGTSSSTISVFNSENEDEKPSTIMIKKSGTTEGAANPENISDEVHACLDPGYFIRLSEAERKSFLIKMFGVGMTFETIKTKLIEKGVKEGLIEELQMHLRLGFQEAAKEAKNQMSVARINWKRITGETHGAIKAEGWRMDVPVFDSEKLTAIQAQIPIAQRIVNGKKSEIEAKKILLETIQKNKELLEKLRDDYEMPVLSEAKINKMQKEVSHLRSLVNAEEKFLSEPEKAKAGPKPKKPINFLLCPSCSTKLLLNSEKSLIQYVPQKPVEVAKKMVKEKVDLEHRKSELNGLKRKLHNLNSAYEQAVRDVRLVEESRIKIEATEAASKFTDHIEGSDEELAEALDHTEKELALLLESEEREIATGMEVDRTTRINKEATHLHNEFNSWSVLYDQMSPTGIPTEILKPCVDCINKSLAMHSEQTKWGPVKITDDCAITYKGMNYYLLSESEQWRVDVMIAAAIAEDSDYKFLMVDRVDILSPTNRPVFLAWCRFMAEEFHFQFLLFATLKSAKLPPLYADWLQSVWLEDGSN